MTEPNEPDEISQELNTIFDDYFGPPTELDLRGVDPATFALGLSFGFETWQQVRVVANNKRDVGKARSHWNDGHHPSREFLSHAVGADERARGHRELLERAHGECSSCAARLREMSAPDLDGTSPGGEPDLLDTEWMEFQPVAVTREADPGEPGEPGRLHIPGRRPSEAIAAQDYGGGNWRITVRHPSAATVRGRIEWSSGQVDRFTEPLRHELAEVAAQAPEIGAQPAKIQTEFLDPA
jgi:hypothetical protein